MDEEIIKKRDTAVSIALDTLTAVLQGKEFVPTGVTKELAEVIQILSSAF